MGGRHIFQGKINAEQDKPGTGFQKILKRSENPDHSGINNHSSFENTQN